MLTLNHSPGPLLLQSALVTVSIPFHSLCLVNKDFQNHCTIVENFSMFGNSYVQKLRNYILVVRMLFSHISLCILYKIMNNDTETYLHVYVLFI